MLERCCPATDRLRRRLCPAFHQPVTGAEDTDDSSGTGGDRAGKEHRLLQEKLNGGQQLSIAQEPPYNLSFYDSLLDELAAAEQQKETIGLAVKLSKKGLEDATLSLEAALKEWLRQEIESRLDRNAERMKVSSGRRVGIRMQRTRWGSCSGRGNLNFNLRLAALPDWLREYVVIHELAHLRVPSHSPAFWSIVAEHSPDYREAEAELRRYWVIIENNAIWQQIRDYWS